jgi:hypothetical protein
VEERPEDASKPQSDRRAHRRISVSEEGELLLLDHSTRVHCRVIDVSLEGARVETRGPVQTGLHGRVENQFKINGIAFRFSGAIQWTSDRGLLGIRFMSQMQRRRDELAEVLDEMDKANEVDARKQESPGLAQTRSSSQPESQPAPAPHPRRAFPRYEVDSEATVHLVRFGSSAKGRILDLSLGGCRIRTHDRFPVDIYRRVETEFCLQGLPFRLSGVIQSIQDEVVLGIRFLDVSERRRHQLEQLIREIATK